MAKGNRSHQSNWHTTKKKDSKDHQQSLGNELESINYVLRIMDDYYRNEEKLSATKMIIIYFLIFTGPLNEF